MFDQLTGIILLSLFPSTLHGLDVLNSTQSAVRCERFLCQHWIITTCLPKITLPLSPLSSSSPPYTHVSCKLKSWRADCHGCELWRQFCIQSASWGIWKPQNLKKWLFCQDNVLRELTLSSRLGPAVRKSCREPDRNKSLYHLIDHLHNFFLFFCSFFTLQGTKLKIHREQQGGLMLFSWEWISKKHSCTEEKLRVLR